MDSQLLDLAARMPSYCVAACAVALVVAVKFSQRSKLDAIPTVGSTSWPGSWWAGLKHMINAFDVIKEGYYKHKRAPFKIALFNRWLVLISSREHVEEMCRAPVESLSFIDGITDEFQAEYTLGYGVLHNPYHIPILRSQLSRSIGSLYSEIRNEIITAFDDILDLKDNEWKGIPAYHSIETVICRVSNRMFVGLPLCRDPDWINLNIQHTLSVAKGALIVRLFPTFLKPLAVRLFTKVAESNALATKLVGPIIEERLSYLNEYGNLWADKPNDFLSWLMDQAEGAERTVEALTARLLFVNLLSIHTSSINFTHALLYLAANPQYMRPLREEVESIVEKEGWSKAALGKMHKIDSFLKECERMEGFSGVMLVRKAMTDFTFTDGTCVPKGTCVAVATQCVHHDETVYPNAHAFEPFRFAELHAEADGEGVKHQFATTTPQYLPFGHGRHACPARFFAANELKSMLAHVVTTYDVQLKENTTWPRTLHIGMTMKMPDPNATILFRKRAD